MNLYEISVVDGKGITHKSKIYEINMDAAFKEAFIQGKIYGAEKLDDCTVQQIQTNAGVSKDTEREYLGRIKNILDALGPNSYCAMAFEGCVGDAEENIDSDFAVSMEKMSKAADLSMGAVFKLTRPGAELEQARFGTVMKLAAGLGAVITVDPEGVTIRPQEEAK